jgi:hypothetical protein
MKFVKTGHYDAEDSTLSILFEATDEELQRFDENNEANKKQAGTDFLDGDYYGANVFLIPGRGETVDQMVSRLKEKFTSVATTVKTALETARTQLLTHTNGYLSLGEVSEDGKKQDVSFSVPVAEAQAFESARENKSSLFTPAMHLCMAQETQFIVNALDIASRNQLEEALVQIYNGTYNNTPEIQSVPGEFPGLGLHR